jgi:hypothetical protein
MPYEYIRLADGSVQCPHCDYTKTYQSAVHMHITAKHSGAFKHKCSVTGCGREFAQKQPLTAHIASAHPESLDQPPPQYPCPHTGCEKEFNSKGKVRSHYMVKHRGAEMRKLLGTTEDGELICTHCGKICNSMPAFTYHVVGCLPTETRNCDEIANGLGLGMREPVG